MNRVEQMKQIQKEALDLFTKKILTMVMPFLNTVLLEY
jgi:hypothetical protein